MRALEAEISLLYSSSLVAKSVMNALSPDNKLTDSGMKVSAHVRGRTLKVRIMDCKRIETLQATVQDIFRCIRAAESSLSLLASQ